MKKILLLLLVALPAFAGRVIEMDSLTDNRTKATLATSTEVATLSGATGNIQSSINTLQSVTGGFVLKTGDSMSGALSILGNITNVFNAITLKNSATSGASANAQMLLYTYDGSAVSLNGAFGLSSNTFSFNDYLPNQLFVEGLGNGGVGIFSMNGTGEIRMYTGGGNAGNKRMYITNTGDVTVTGGTLIVNGPISGTAALTGVTSLTVGSGATSLSGSLAVTGNSVLSNVAVGGTAAASVGVWVKSTQSLTGSTNWGFSSGPTFNATTAGNAFESFPNIAAGVTTAVISHFLADGLGKGAGAIATRNAVVLGTGGALTGGVNNAFLSDNTSWTGNYFINQSGTTQSSLAGPVTVSNTLTASTVNVTGLTASSMAATDGAKNLVSKGLPESYLPFASGSLTSIVANEIVGYGKTERALTIENLSAAASTFTCPITSPVLTLFDCGTSAGACTAGTTTLGSVTVTGAAGVAGVVASASLAAGHYWAWEITGGSCTSLNVTGTAQAGMQ